FRETEIPGVFACGNVLHVHDLVDYVTLESQIAGEGAARYIKGEVQPEDFVETKGISGVRYVVPQRVNRKSEKDVKLYFRVGEVYKNARVKVSCGGKVVSDRKKPKLAPGEMESVVGKADVLNAMEPCSEITIQVEAV
ncbi:MAG: pyridine nucleotide-disulfide oxidoreductase, partial [Clostridiales bacterium]|nr:pyridine nucleotide-disulfide oxidoreductase [Clostridiales bacterium]